MYSQQVAPADSSAYKDERGPFREARETHLQALRVRLTEQAASQAPVSSSASAITFSVNTTDDEDDGSCDITHCSLREAIQAANATAAEDAITFSIGGGGGQTIVLAGVLPAITQPVILDGTTQPGYVDAPIIEINGAGAGLTADGLVITGEGSTIRGLVINRFGANGIVLDGAGAFNNKIEGNFIGTDVNGTGHLGNGLSGVLVQQGAHDNVIGGTSAEARNIISGNQDFGVLIRHTTTTANRVEGNFIGIDVTGTLGLSNDNDGVRIEGGPDENIIGGTADGAGNVISGNGEDGVEIHGGTSTLNRIEGNFIGTNAAGTAAISNSKQGMVLQVNTFDNVVGGTANGAGNVISANQRNGIYLNDSSTSGNRIEGNFIGTDVTGTLDLGNTLVGIYLILSTIDNVIGGLVPEAGNTIAFNGLGGIELDFGAGTNNAILGNSIFENSSLGIDLDGDGATTNDPGDPDTGSNHLQNFPDFTDAFINSDDDLFVTYSVDTDPANATYPLTVEFFKADADDQEGQVFLGRSSYTTADHDGCGTAPCETTVNLGDAAVLGVSAGDRLVATATDFDSNTSEFSFPAREVGGAEGEIFVVINTNDSGAGSLRQAILDANASTNSNEPDEIHFAIDAQTDPGCDSGTGVCTVAVQSELPTITEAVVTDGETQEGADCGSDIPSRMLKIEIDGSGAPADTDGIVITSNGSTVRGLVINGFDGNGGAGVVLMGASANANTVACNFIGTDVTGTADLGNVRGVYLLNGASNNTIGGTDPGAGNLISGNVRGIAMISSGTTDNKVQGNFIGTDATGTADLGNGLNGVTISIDAANNTIGGTDPGAGNLISGNDQIGVFITTDGATGNKVQGNYIGTDVTGNADLGNTAAGVRVEQGASNTLIGGTDPGASNLVSGNQYGIHLVSASGTLIQGNLIGTDITGTMDLGNELEGVRFRGSVLGTTLGGSVSGAGNIIAFNTRGVGTVLSTGTGNAILQNSIFSNTGLGIDLDNDGITPNDAGDGDTGPNNLQNFPDLTDAVIDADDNLLVTYRVDTDPANATYLLTIEFFKANADDQEGQVFLGRSSYTMTDHNGCGMPPCEATVNLGDAATLDVSAGDKLVATATDDDGNTSEFSATLEVSSNVFLVTNTNDSGAGSLRQAILDANASANGSESDEIHFAIDAQTDPGCDSGTGVCTIAVLSELPAITEAVVLDGETQEGADCGEDIPSRTLKIVLSGEMASLIEGLIITSSGSTIRGLVIQQFDDRRGILITGAGATDNIIACNLIGPHVSGTSAPTSSQDAIWFDQNASNNTIGGTTSEAGNLISGGNRVGITIFRGSANRIQGNFIGTDLTGTVDLGNSSDGIYAALTSIDNIIGGTSAAERNVISGNDGEGITLDAANNRVEGNFIGTDLTGTVALGNTSLGVFITKENNIIGGTAPGTGNVISGNRDGISIEHNAFGNRIEGNFIGTDLSGTIDLGNDGDGIRFFSNPHDNIIGGTASGAGNTIAFNDGTGINLLSNVGTGKYIIGNSLFENTLLGIDLGGNGLTPNDPGDPDTGPNNLQNFPDLISATIDSDGDLLVTYSVDTDSANATYPLMVEIFRADADDQEGQIFLGRNSYSTTNHSGCGTPLCEATVNLGTATTLGVAEGDRLVATATDDEGNTSEFSMNRMVVASVTRYVATDGSDVGNDCTDSQNPCATLPHAVSQANPGDTIDLAAGTYDGLGVLIEKALTIQGAGVVVE